MKRLRVHALLSLFALIAIASTPVAVSEPEKEKSPEDGAWTEVDSLNKQSLGDFLKKFPSGAHAQEAMLAVSLQDTLAEIRNKKVKTQVTIPFPVLGARWTAWQKRSPDKGVIGYFYEKGEKFNSLGWFSPLTGGKTPGGNTVSFDEAGVMVAPTGDGSIIAFKTDGLRYGFLGGVVFETPSDEPIFFGVLDGTGWVHLRGAGRVTLPGGKTVPLK